VPRPGQAYKETKSLELLKWADQLVIGAGKIHVGERYVIHP
jgi:hypothetical protein